MSVSYSSMGSYGAQIRSLLNNELADKLNNFHVLTHKYPLYFTTGDGGTGNKVKIILAVRNGSHLLGATCSNLTTQCGIMFAYSFSSYYEYNNMISRMLLPNKYLPTDSRGQLVQLFLLGLGKLLTDAGFSAMFFTLSQSSNSSIYPYVESLLKPHITLKNRRSGAMISSFTVTREQLLELGNNDKYHLSSAVFVDKPSVKPDVSSETTTPKRKPRKVRTTFEKL